MYALGALFVAMGLLSYVLPHIGAQFQMVQLVGRVHPNAGMIFLVIGGVFCFLGLCLDRKIARLRPGVIDSLTKIVSIDDEEEARSAKPSRGGLVGLLIVLGLLAGGGYYLHEKYGSFDEAVKSLKAELEKAFDKPSSGQPSAPAQASDPARYDAPQRSFETGRSSEPIPDWEVLEEAGYRR